MPLEWNLQGPTGNEIKLSGESLFNQLHSRGENPIAMSPDGQRITFQDGQGNFDVRTDALLKDLGWQIHGVNPLNPVADYAKPEWRVAVAKLPNDSIRAAYLKEQMGQMGAGDAQIVGQGTDWYVFHPQSGQYYAMTNKPGLDVTDLASAGSMAPAMIASLAAGAGGAALAGPAGLVGGAALGEAAGETAIRAYLASHDPIYARMARENLGAMAKDVGTQAAFAGGTAGVFRALPALAGALRGAGAGEATRRVLEFSPLGSTLRGAGTIAEEGGKLGQFVTRAANKPLGREITAGLMPGTAELSTLGYVAQAPAFAARAGLTGLERFGGQIGSRVVRGSTREPIEGGLSGLANRLRTTPMAPEAAPTRINLESSLGNLGRELGGEAQLRRAMVQRYKDLRGMGMMEAGTARQPLPAHQAAVYARLATERDPALQALREGAQTWGQRGASLGRTLGTLERAGEAGVNTANAIAGGVAGLGHAASTGARYGGAALRGTGQLLQPVESRLAARYGAEELLTPQEPYWRRRQRVLPFTSELVSNY